MDHLYINVGIGKVNVTSDDFPYTCYFIYDINDSSFYSTKNIYIKVPPNGRLATLQINGIPTECIVFSQGCSGIPPFCWILCFIYLI